jgi:hypothetical protein
MDRKYVIHRAGCDVGAGRSLVKFADKKFVVV